MKRSRSRAAGIVVQPHLRTADCPLHDRPVPKSVDQKENPSAISLGMTGFPPRSGCERGGVAVRENLGRVAVWFLLAAIRFYQAVFAPMMPVGCKFYPSCSRYAAEAIARHGAIRGLRLALARLWRCRPFTQGGVDLVPEADEFLCREGGSEVHS